MKWATAFLLAANLLTYFILSYLGFREFGTGLTEIHRYYVDILGLNKGVLLEQGYVWQFLTSIFLHLNLTHLGYNLLFLGVFGHLAEEVFGGRRTILIFLLSGIAVAATAFIFYPGAVFGGSSGAVLGLVGAVVAAREKKPLLEVAAVLALVFFIAVSGVYLAHLIGMVSGILIARTIRRLGSRTPRGFSPFG